MKNEKNQVTVEVDYENNATEWWDNGGRDLWAELSPNGKDRVTIPRAEFVSWRQRARLIRGWDTGPEHAREPVTALEYLGGGE